MYIIKIQNNPKQHLLFQFILFIPLLSLFIGNAISSTLFKNSTLHRGFIEDYPALWLTSIGIILLIKLMLKYNSVLNRVHLEILKPSKQSMFLIRFRLILNLIVAILLILLSLLINHAWVSSQLNDGLNTWTTYNGSMPYFLGAYYLERFNLIGYIYYFICILYWFLFLLNTLLFVNSLKNLIIHLFKNRNQKDIKTIESQKTIKDYIITSSMIVFLFLFYYVSLQINDIIIEGFETFKLHPNRFIMLIIAVILLVSYSLISTLIKFFTFTYTKNTSPIIKFIKSEVIYDFYIVIIPFCILTFYAILVNFLFKNETYLFKSALSFYLFIIILFAVVTNQFSKNMRAQQLNHLLAENNHLVNYTKTVEGLYHEMRHYKHDITNILLSLRTFIDKEDFDSLQSYFYQEILDKSPTNNSHYKLISHIEPIKNMPLKGLLLSKLGPLTSRNILMDIEVFDLPPVLPITNNDLCRIMGILLDNAIEAIETSQNKELLISMTNSNSNYDIIVGNSYNNEVDLQQLFDLNYSTKGLKRGTGLHSLNHILKKYPKVKLKTSVTNDWFLQKLTLATID